MRVMARRTPRPVGKPARLGEHPDWEYGAFVTNTVVGQVQFLDAPHRTQAHVEDRMKQFKACGARNLPSIDYGRNAAWSQRRLAATHRAGHLADRLAAPHRTRRSAGHRRHQDAALPDPVRPGEAGHPRPQTNPEDPSRLDLVTRPGRRLGPPPGPAPALTRPLTGPSEPPQHTAAWNRRPPEHPRAAGHARPPDEPPEDPQCRTIMTQWISVNDQGQRRSARRVACTIRLGPTILHGCRQKPSRPSRRARSPQRKTGRRLGAREFRLSLERSSSNSA